VRSAPRTERDLKGTDFEKGYSWEWKTPREVENRTDKSMRIKRSSVGHMEHGENGEVYSITL